MSSSSSAVMSSGMLLLRPRFALVFLTVLALLLPLLLPEVVAPLFARAEPLARAPLGALLVLVAAGAMAWLAPGGATGAAAALFALALLHGARMAPMLASVSSSVGSFPMRAAVAVGAAAGTLALLQRFPSAREGYMILGAAALAHVVGMLSLAPRGNSVAGFAALDTLSSPAATADPVAPSADVAAPLASGPPVEVAAAAVPMVAPGAAPAAAPLAAETAAGTAAGIGGAEYSGQLEQHMVQLRAPPGRATPVWNAPPYGPALGVGALAAAGSFKGDMSEVVQRLTTAGGIKTV